ncbi:hypothetical protein TNCV_4819781 [Trichonephila clavipes]|nr:hypothetical protein TNCV_4819781 [Trichonephila clavipes]
MKFQCISVPLYVIGRIWHAPTTEFDVGSSFTAATIARSYTVGFLVQWGNLKNLVHRDEVTSCSSVFCMYDGHRAAATYTLIHSKAPSQTS